jgi:soluble lytic murein transglycosylase-like protein
MYSDTIVREAKLKKLDPEVVAAVIKQESNGNPWAYRYEPGFYDRYLKGKKASDLSGFVPAQIPTFDSELMARATSWGLMQIMGDSARWAAKITNPYLTVLLDPEINIKAGTDYLQRLFLTEPSKGPREATIKVLKRWNGSFSYPWRIIEIIEKNQHLDFLPPGYPISFAKWFHSSS